MRYNQKVPIIHRLDEDLIPKIAAGEVVESTASIVKELVENSLDAGATLLTMDIENGGLTKIKITDNGIGMDPPDVENCWLPHTTSKISNQDDLLAIKTLGFRGEALSSISAVAHLSLKSRATFQDSGTQITIDGGTFISSKKVGMNVGTTIEVSDIFYNIPARKKFLKSPQTESKKILDVIVSYALAYPQVKFKFSRDGKSVLDLSNPDDLFSRVYKIVGDELFVNLIPFEKSFERFSINGFISKPQSSTYSKSDQHLFVNNRAVSNETVSRAIKDAYGKLLEHKAFPPFILYLKVQPDLVDVNIHPRKEEISFWNDSVIYDTLTDFFKDFLEHQDLTFVKDSYEDVFAETKKASEYPFLKLKDSVDKWSLKSYESIPEDSILQIDNTYLITTTKEGAILVDQHAAHESILYEEYLAELYKTLQQKEIVTLGEPSVISLSLSLSQSLEEYLETLESLGFSITPFGQNTFKIDAVPAMFKTHNLQKLIQELLLELQDSRNGKLNNIDEKSRKTIAFLSCRGAVKAGEKLTLEERRNIIKKLETSKNIYTCPHGRPVKIILTNRELARLFKRIK